ncbi:Mal regulon transcriptional regulator MalI [Pantoea sp. At-9b]|uniref:Mal regulon transcriptional regulator MalI n=1 Tax=Pantoea sp. (strain At-9b) TaxID=592316 RepID=UPI0001B3E804|nr:Mal regulon transcriptional regulator MalI [Pantoea sp. At-9b]ADU69074.1 transcriptional regulator, LacI family [Pantoea sp. At-9b]
MTQQKITIHEVAEAAGVSVTTVSLVLSGKGRISTATSARVNQAIEQLGYIRNRSAAVLRGAESGVIGLIVRDLSQPFYAAMTAGLSEVLEQQGKMLVLTQSGHHGQQLERCFASLVAQGVDGVILGGAPEQAEKWVAQAQEQGIALVCAARASSLDQVDSLHPDNSQAARLATEYLIRKGHQRIAWIGGSTASLTRAERIGGYCATLLQYGLPFRPEWIIECGDRQPEVAAVTAQLLRQHPGITAILAHNATVTLGCYFGALHSGRTLAEGAVGSYYSQQLALVGFNDDPQRELYDPALTFVSSGAREVGRRAGQRMLQRLAQPSGEVQTLIVPPLLLPGRA